MEKGSAVRNRKMISAVVGVATTTVLATGLTAVTMGTASARPETSACTTSAVKLSWDINAIQTAGPGENAAVVKVKNTSRHACTVSGFPTVVLHTKDFDWKLKHSSKSRSYKLNPGKTASFTIGYVRVHEEDSRAVTPSKVSVTLPGQRKAIKVSWPYGDIADQSMMRLPQTFSTSFFR
jgi:hypothetical protein